VSFIDQALQTRKEKEVAPEGEYTLTIEDARLRPDGRNVSIRLSIDGHPEYIAVFHNMALVQDGDDEDKANTKRLFQAAFLEAFDIPFEDGYDLQDFPGSKGTVRLTQDEYQGRVSNNIALSF
jgi:hypothetical protein